MSGSETGVMANREPFSVGIQNNSLQSQPMTQNMELYSVDGSGASVYKPPTSTSPSYQSSVTGVIGNAGIDGSGGVSVLPHGFNINSGSSEQLKRKRGRPRKYGPDGSMALALGSVSPSVAPTQSSGGFSPSTIAVPASDGLGLASPNSLKKNKGRPPGSSKKRKLEALGSAGIGFTPHFINVKAGEVLI